MHRRKKVIAIIQARMGSVRLFGKIMLKIMERPMLWHIVTRLSRCSYIDKIVIATTVSKKDNIVEGFCKKYNIDFYRGSEEDVLDRYYQAMRIYEADAVVRITGDCPLIDPTVTDKVIKSYLKNAKDFDGASNTINRTYPRGFDTEVVSSFAMEEAWKKAKKDYQKEHVTPYIYEHPKLFNIYSVENNKDLSCLRWTVDEKEDLRFVREIYKRLYREGKVFLMKDIIRTLEKEPSLKGINKDVRQKRIIK